jgi:hypothetical protein
MKTTSSQQRMTALQMMKRQMNSRIMLGWLRGTSEQRSLVFMAAKLEILQ